MVTSPVSRFTTTPEQPPGQASAAPLLVKRASNGLETSVHVSAAWIEAGSTPTLMQMNSTTPGLDARASTETTVGVFMGTHYSQAPLFGPVLNSHFRVFR